jgi:PAS domain S-box-containing protein
MAAIAEPDACPALPLHALQGMLEAVAAPVLLDDGARIVGANDAMCRLLARAPAELMSAEAQAWVAPAQREALRAYTQRCLASTQPQPALELEAVTAYGSVRHLEITGRQLLTEAGRLALITCTDLSDMRHVQSSLLEVGRVMQQIIETDPVATFVIDAEHRVTHWNAACARLSGIAAHEMIGSTEAWRAFYARPQPVLADLVVDGRVEGGRTVLGAGIVQASTTLPDTHECEAHFACVGGRPRWLHFTATPLRDTAGRIVGAIETLQDITARRDAEQQVRRHQAELEQIVAQRTAELLLTHHELDAFLENASVGIIATRGTLVTRCNRKFAEIFELDTGVPQHEVDTRRFFADKAGRRRLVQLMRDSLPNGRPLSHEMRAITAQGRTIWLQMIAYAADLKDPLASVWWILQDRTEVMRVQEELVQNFRAIKQTNQRLEEAQNQLLQSEKMASIGQLAAGVAHEINNPIGFVNSNLGSLRRYVEQLLAVVAAYGRHREEIDDAGLAALEREADLDYIAEDLPALLRESEEGLSRVKKIVQDLKDFSRVDSADWQDADLNAGIESTLNVVMNEVKYRADVERRYGTLPPVRCLAGQLNQVFMNLIVNAAHAIEGQRGLITLSSGCQPREGLDGVWVEVADNGKGMAPEIQRRVFEPFFTTKPVGQGTGLGLSLSFSIVKKHGGCIEVQSQPGAGTRFRLWVPVAGPGAADNTTSGVPRCQPQASASGCVP